MDMDTKAFIGRLAENMQIGKGECKELMRAFVNTICDILREGDVIKWRGVFQFGARYRSPGTLVHPTTGETIEYPGKYIPYCYPGKIISDAVNAAHNPKYEGEREEDHDN